MAKWVVNQRGPATNVEYHTFTAAPANDTIITGEVGRTIVVDWVRVWSPRPAEWTLYYGIGNSRFGPRVCTDWSALTLYQTWCPYGPREGDDVTVICTYDGASELTVGYHYEDEGTGTSSSSGSCGCG